MTGMFSSDIALDGIRMDPGVCESKTSFCVSRNITLLYVHYYPIHLG